MTSQCLFGLCVCILVCSIVCLFAGGGLSLTAGSRSILGDRNVSRHHSLADNEIISFYSVFAGIHKLNQSISRSVFTSTAFTKQLDCGAHFANSAELKSSSSNKIIELISAMCIVSMFHLNSNLKVATRWSVPKLPVNVFSIQIAHPGSYPQHMLPKW